MPSLGGAALFRVGRVFERARGTGLVSDRMAKRAARRERAALAAKEQGEKRGLAHDAAKSEGAEAEKGVLGAEDGTALRSKKNARRFSKQRNPSPQTGDAESAPAKSPSSTKAEIESLFAPLKEARQKKEEASLKRRRRPDDGPQPSSEKKRKKSKTQRLQRHSSEGPEASALRRRTADGLLVYSMEELKIGRRGGPSAQGLRERWEEELVGVSLPLCCAQEKAAALLSVLSTAVVVSDAKRACLRRGAALSQRRQLDPSFKRRQVLEKESGV